MSYFARVLPDLVTPTTAKGSGVQNSMARQLESRRVNAVDPVLIESKHNISVAEEAVRSLIRVFASALAEDINSLPAKEIEVLSGYLSAESLSPITSRLIDLLNSSFSIDQMCAVTDEYLVSHKAYAALHTLVSQTFHDIGITRNPLPSPQDMSNYKSRLNKKMLDMNPQPCKRSGIKLDFDKVLQHDILSDEPYDSVVSVVDVFIFIDASDGERGRKVEFVRMKNGTRLVAAHNHVHGETCPNCHAPHPKPTISSMKVRHFQRASDCREVVIFEMGKHDDETPEVSLSTWHVLPLQF